VTGDFLIRESAKVPGQFVLSGRSKDQYKHLLLVDPDGVVSQAKIVRCIIDHSCVRSLDSHKRL
jgi:hypothetical protein